MVIPRPTWTRAPRWDPRSPLLSRWVSSTGRAFAGRDERLDICSHAGAVGGGIPARPGRQISPRRTHPTRSSPKTGSLGIDVGGLRGGVLFVWGLDGDRSAGEYHEREGCCCMV